MEVIMARRKCPNCGKFIAEKATYCVYCSTIFETPKKEDSETMCESLKDISEKEGKEDVSSLYEPSVKEEGVPIKEFSEEDDETTMETDEENDGYGEEYPEEDIELEETEDEDSLSLNEEEIRKMQQLLKHNDETETEQTSIMEGQKEDNLSFAKELLFNRANGLKRKIIKSKEPEDTLENESGEIKDEQTKENALKIKEDKKEISPKSEYDPNYDNYYDNVIALCDARIEHLNKEKLVKTIGLITACILIFGFMIYFTL